MYLKKKRRGRRKPALNDFMKKTPLKSGVFWYNSALEK
jgi:hypothetical protein